MRTGLISFVAAVFFMPLPAFADAVENAILGQLEAFKSRQVETAWRYASPFVQQVFKDPVIFGAMVQSGFDVIWNNEAVRFGLRAEMEGRVRQLVIVVGPNQNEQAYEYDMILINELWRINGVRPVKLSDISI